MVVTSLPASTSLLNEINWLAPRRDKSSDGTIGDTAHASGSSDHNPDDTPGVRTPDSDPDRIPEVHARDVDSSGPWPPGWSMERIVQIIVGRQRQGLDHRLQNVIYNRRIWSRSWGWTQRAYTGADPHTNHAHFSFRYGSGGGMSNPENITSPWGIRAAREDEIVTPEDRTWIANTIRSVVKEELDKRVGDIVRRYNPDGSWVPTTDPNPTMTVATGVQYTGRYAYLVQSEVQGVVIPAIQRIEAELAELRALVQPTQ